MMITSLEHTRLLVRDLDVAVAAYRQILGLEPVLQADADGVSCVVFTPGKSSLRIVSPTGAGPCADGLRAALDTGGEGLSGLCFAVDDVERAFRRLRRLSLAPAEPAPILLSDAATGVSLAWRATSLPESFTGGLRVSLAQAQAHAAGKPSPARSRVIAEAPIADIDLVVVATSQPERAAALYGARLGLELVFDRVMGQGGTRLQQFAVGDQLVEVTHRLEHAGREQPDRLWGIAWAVTDIDATHGRLASAGRNVSAVKVGAKPGTRVFTLRDGTCGVPTLIVQNGVKDGSKDGSKT